MERDTNDYFADYHSAPVFVDYDELGNQGIDEDSNPLHILETLEERNDWNFTPLEALMANAVPVPF